MNNDPKLNDLLKWSINASTTTTTGDDSTPQIQAPNAEALAALFGNRKSDAQLMQEAMLVINSQDPVVTPDDRLTAFDNFEQLVENLDNANNMENLALWPPLLRLLGHAEPDMRMYAAWCVGTAVQNNGKTQEALRNKGSDGLPALLNMAVTDTDKSVRKKAIGAISSATRNYQAGLDAVQAALPKDLAIEQKLDAADMDSVDVLINKLREHSARLE
ncbi:Fes1-domain-containing protein [Pseudovirgaria hyperparasitica]|uniref:Fes1-domain-containing protein n=1 Tax=Pseudovirgaria hyperparasitica TaxID=470096 RepID=A0A6A6W0C1_9PEZI|nr:Fes1-domain-containing protein [Pseudovirgaria hyperparasitica]KAF2755579.1 Fes1-domain-containing protein [Pseudovirgaria hyperparasitica]